MLNYKKMNPHLSQVSIKTKLEAVLLLILVLSGIITSVVLYREHINSLQTEIIQIHKSSARLFHRLLESDAEGLGRALAGFVHDQSLIALFKDRDRNQLISQFKPAFDDLYAEHNISHVNFIDAQGVVFLRIRELQHYGDTLERKTFRKAVNDGQLTCGIEMGKFFFSLRCVHPISDHGAIIGYMEMAEEIDHLFRQLKETTGDSLGLLFSEAFTKNHPILSQYPKVGQFTLLYADDLVMMQSLLSAIDLKPGTATGIDKIFEKNKRHYAIGVTQFKDISAEPIGLLVSLRDISSYYSNALQDLQINIGTLLLIIASAFVLFVIAIKRAFDILEAQLTHRTQQIEYMAYHDDLTDLPNRAMFSKLIKQHISEAKRYKRKFSLLFIDLDGFKAVNDSLGHEAGDQLLNEVAQRIKSSLRESDIISRMGGDEFIALLPEVADETVEGERAEIAAERILESVSKSFTLSGQEAWITTSIGISTYPDNGEQASELTKHADAAMYAAKRAGKNKAQRYHDLLSGPYFERIALESDLRRALEKDEFKIYYQAKLETSQNTVIGMEALIRWQHPTLGLIEPAKFIRIAEETGLIVPIGLWVIRRACEQNMHWRSIGLPFMTLTVNLSPGQLLNLHIVDDIARILENTGMPASFLMVDITERILFQNQDHIKETLFGLKKLGIHVAIDDLGVGYSSFNTLDNFPVDTLKIDRSFTRGLPQNAHNKAIVEAIINLGQKLGLTVYAEGVETDEQMLFLKNNSCTQLQGYLFNKPMPADEFEAFVTQHIASNNA